MRWLAALLVVPAWTAHAPTTSIASAAPVIPDVVFGASPTDGTSQFIVQFRSEAALDTAVAQLDQRGHPANDTFDAGINALTIDADNPELIRLAQSPQVAAVEPDRTYSIGAVASWGLDRIDQRSLPLNNTYTHSTSGSGVTAYIIDTGLNLTHQEFTGRIPRAAHASSFPDSIDCNGHGTHVAGTIGGTTYGVAPLVSIVPIRVFGCTGSASGSDILAALDWVVTDHVAGVPAVLNMSLGGAASSVLDDAVNAVIADGVTAVVAAGNDAVDACTSSPARAPSAITVGASTSTDARASFSNFGTCLDLFAPGDLITSAYWTSDTAAAVMSGTSMASPHVAGAVALYLQTRPTATPASVASAILSAATTALPTNRLTGDPARLLYVGPVPLTVTKSGRGSGAITADVGGVDCGAICSGSVTQGTSVTLTATPTGLATFDGWSGGGCTGTGTCTVVMNQATTVSALFTPTEVVVAKSGNGSGTVTSDLGGVNCGATCSSTLANGTSVTLTATPAFGSSFAGWSGGGCSGTGTCTVTIAGSTTVTATFALVPRTLTVSASGPGTVTSDVGGINCGIACGATVDHGTAVVLTATPQANALFSSWSGGGCSGSGACTVSMTGNTSVTATFVATRLLTVSKSGTGSGAITSDVGGINCGSACTTTRVQGTAATLTATPVFGSTFLGWTGGGCSGTGTCAVTLNDHTTVTATFGLVPRLLTVAVSGLGTITSNVGGINCGATCTTTVSHGTTVTLTATANAGAQFTGWTGGGCGAAPTCAVTVTGDQLVSATFAPVFQSFAEPVRLFDTRPGNTGVLEDSADESTRFAPGEVRRYVPGPSVGAPGDAVLAVNVVAVNPSANGYLQVFPCAGTGTAPPAASFLNYAAGITVANNGTVALDGSGGICVLSSQSANVIVDTTGYLPAGSFTALAEPVRLVDSRGGQLGALERAGGTVGADISVPLVGGVPWRFVVTGANGIPTSVAALAMNIAAVNPAGGGFMTVYPCASEATAPPAASTLNYRAGGAIANGAVVATSADGGICVLSSQSAHVILDTTGYFPTTRFTALAAPVRLIDSRAGQTGALEQPGGTVGADISVPLAANTPWRFIVTGANGIPATVKGLALNLVAVGPAGGGFITVYPCASEATAVPASSTINYRPGGTIANGAIVAPSADGGICVLSSQTTNVIIDTTGYFPA